jgi:protein phosphatase PTC7
VEALDVAHRATQLPGSATACLLRLDAALGLLDAANLGDSGFLITGSGGGPRLHFQSPAMQHYFDCPLQVRSRVCAVRTRHRQGL